MSEGGFDVAAYRRGVSDPDRGLLVTFRMHGQQQADGSFKDVEYINIWMSNGETVDRPVIQSDRIRFKDRYESFKAGQTEPETGTLIKHMAFATPANVAACKAERIFTVEQLVETADERLMRAQLINFKYNCIEWLKANKDSKHVVAMRSEIEALKAQIENLKLRLADKPEEPKKPGRPKKVKDDALDAA